MLRGVPELLRLLLATMLPWVRPRRDLVLENLLHRHHLSALTRPTSALACSAGDKVLWILARRLYANLHETLTFVTPDTIARWHRRGAEIGFSHSTLWPARRGGIWENPYETRRLSRRLPAGLNLLRLALDRPRHDLRAPTHAE
jgi:hypothetical protein